MAEISVYTDAGARGNPGPAAIAVLVFEGGKLIKEHGEYIGKATNNQAEYQAVIKGLEMAKDMGASDVRLFTDSELVCRQLKGEYKAKDRKLKPLYEKVREMEKGFERIEWKSVPRENPFIRRADRIVNRVLDSVG
ncbi:MAG: ribonuclease HI family protein [Candidatus Anstonellales archaeon]